MFIIFINYKIIIIRNKLMIVSTDLLIFMVILLCYVYVTLSAYFVHKKCNYIHETTVSILLGIIFGAILISFTEVFSTISYSSQIREVIVLILLPPMLFEDGYNIKKRKFFQNIMYINLYGVLGTVVNFFAMYGIFYVCNHYNLIQSINNQSINLQTWQILAMASCLCSIDTLVPEKIVNPERYPKLFSIIFGESIFKDTISVTLFDSIINVYQNLSSGGAIFNADSVGYLILKFLEVIVCSILIGTAVALITTFIFKKFRFLLDEKGVAEVPIILLTGYAAYILSEWGTFSGVISMLFCGITLSHFNVYNLTDEGKASAKIAVSALSKVAQGLLFFLLGAFIFAIQLSQQDNKSVDYTFSWTLLLITILALIIGRILNVYLMSLIGYFIVGADKWRLNVYEYQILAISGMVKGAIPFALVLAIPSNQSNRFSTASIQNAVIMVVFLTSFFLNSLMPKFLRYMLNKIDDMIRANENHPSLFDSILIEFHEKQSQEKKNHKESFASNRSIKSCQSEIVDKIKSKREMEKLAFHLKLKNTTQKYWRRCQEGFLKPLLIHDYHNRKQQIKMDKIKMRKEEVQEFWRKFRGENMLDPENEEDNKFIDVKLVENDNYSEDQEVEPKIVEQNGQQVLYIKKERSKTKMEQQITQIKYSKSKTEMPKDTISKMIEPGQKNVSVKQKSQLPAILEKQPQVENRNNKERNLQTEKGQLNQSLLSD